MNLPSSPKTHPLALLVLLVGTLWSPVVVAEVPPSLLLLTLDTVRADHLGAYGGTDADTPHLDALARSARVHLDTLAA